MDLVDVGLSEGFLRVGEGADAKDLGDDQPTSPSDTGRLKFRARLVKVIAKSSD